MFQSTHSRSGQYAHLITSEFPQITTELRSSSDSSKVYAILGILCNAVGHAAEGLEPWLSRIFDCRAWAFHRSAKFAFQSFRLGQCLAQLRAPGLFLHGIAPAKNMGDCFFQMCFILFIISFAYATRALKSVSDEAVSVSLAEHAQNGLRYR